MHNAILSPSDDQFVASPQAAITELSEFAYFMDSCPLANPHLYTERDVYGMEHFHCPAWLAAWPCSLPAPAHLLISRTRDTGKSPWFLSNNKNHQCYQHSSGTKSKTQQLLGLKLTLS